MNEIRDYKSDLQQSVEFFNSKIWTKISDYLGGGRIIAAETCSCELCQLMDRNSGIDYLQYLPDCGTRLLASRVQWDGINWQSFTIRCSRESGALTEYAKRKRDIKNGYIYPQYTIQGFVKYPDEVLSVAAIKTIDLFDFVEKASYIERRTTGNASFLCVWWSNLEDAGYELIRA